METKQLTCQWKTIFSLLPFNCLSKHIQKLSRWTVVLTGWENENSLPSDLSVKFLIKFILVSLLKGTLNIYIKNHKDYGIPRRTLKKFKIFIIIWKRFPIHLVSFFLVLIILTPSNRNQTPHTRLIERNILSILYVINYIGMMRWKPKCFHTIFIHYSIFKYSLWKHNIFFLNVYPNNADITYIMWMSCAYWHRGNEKIILIALWYWPTKKIGSKICGFCLPKNQWLLLWGWNRFLFSKGFIFYWEDFVYGFGRLVL